LDVHHCISPLVHEPIQAQKEKKPAAHAPTQTSPEKLQRKGIAKEGELIGFLAGVVKGAIVIL
jgi:hypothetical protein